MWNWFNCYLSGRHDYGMWCEPGTIFLRCVHCGRRSGGWSLGADPQPIAAAPKPAAAVKSAASVSAPVLPFDRQVAR